MIKNRNSKTAKLDRQLFFRIGRGELPITGNAINFMLYTITYVAKDGRIYLDAYQIRERLKMQNKTFNRVIRELKFLNLLFEKEGFFYSRFHVLSNGEKSDKGYVRNIKALSSDDVLLLTIKKKRFFLYVASFSLIGIPKSISVEALYNNKYHSGVNYIESYHELSEILFEFVQKGYFVVYINGKRYDKSSSDFQRVFHDYCGYDQVNGKQRMSKVKKNIIGIGIHEDLKRNIVSNQSSREEFVYYANKNYIYHELMRPETIPFFISIQNELFDMFGKIGVDIYRSALITYFSTEQENVLYHDLMSNKKETKAANTLMDFYLIKEIQDIILNVVTKNNINDQTRYFMDENRLSKLVLYFIQKSSDNQKVLFDSALEAQGLQLHELIKIGSNSDVANSWGLLENHISDIYNRIEVDLDMKESDQKEIVREWAKNCILAKKEWIEQKVKQLKDKTAPFVNRERINTNKNHESKRNDTSKSRAELSQKLLDMQMQSGKDLEIRNIVIDF